MTRLGIVAAVAFAVLLCACSKTAEQSAGGASPEASAAPTVEASSVAVGTATPAPVCSPGSNTLNATYFVLPPNHPDVNHEIDDQIVTGLVAPHLGPDGWPVVTQTAKTGTQASGPITDVNSSGEILWWSTTSTKGVKLEKTITECLPIDNHSMYPDGASGDDNGYLTAHYQGGFTVPSTGTVGLNLGSDDDSWVFIDGQLMVDNGGVKPLATAPYKSAQLAPGNHVIDIFYADRHGTGAELALQPGFPVSRSTATPAAAAASAAPVAVATATATPVPTAAPTATPSPSRTATPMPIAKQLRTQHRIRIYGIHFDVDKATIQPQSEAIIAQIAKVMRDNPTWRFRVEGHTDSDGGYDHNVALSQARAQAVVSDLVNRYHIAPARLMAVGYWYSHPVAPNTTPANKALNRRVEIVLL